MKSFKVGILGATGAVGQKFVRLLEPHPWFEIAVVAASERSAGKTYREAAHWIENTRLPESVGRLTVKHCTPEECSEADFVFSGLDSSVASEIEKDFAKAGIPVISNAKNHRMDPSVPLLIPEVNAGHADLIHKQEFTPDGTGWIVTNPNCVSVPLALSLKPLHDAFGVHSVVCTSMQSVSGAGYPGVSSMDILGNIIPYIGGEEDKVESESKKLLGRVSDGQFTFAQMNIQATAVRVPTLEGHLLSVAVGLDRKPGTAEELQEAFTRWGNPLSGLDLPSSPAVPVKLYEEDRFPQPRLHADREGGMQTAIGRLRMGSVLDVSYVTMAHNTIRGAAGGAILNAELLAAREYLQ